MDLLVYLKGSVNGSMPASEREKWIDNAKGIAILLVIVGHVYSGLQGFIDFNFVYGFHLVVFFLLSGFTLKKQNIGREYINKKFSRLMTPYFYTSLAVIVGDIINCKIIHHDFTIKKVTNIISRDLMRSFFASGTITLFGGIDLGTRIGAIWFLPALFFGILIVQIVLKYCDKPGKKGLPWIAFSFIAILGSVSARFIWLPFSIQSAMMAALFIYMGYQIRETALLRKVKWFHYIIALIILLIGIRLGYCGISFAQANMNDLLLSIPIGLAGCLLVYGISKAYKGQLFQCLGQRSLIILCVHLFALETMGNHIQKIIDILGLTGNNATWARIGIHILFAVLIAISIDLLIRANGTIRKTLSTRIIISRKHNQNRDYTIDIARGIFIISMIIGHMNIDEGMRTIIFSCHMIAFLFFSGYFYNRNKSISESIQTMIRSLLFPYLLFVCGKLLLNINQWNGEYIKNTLIQYLIGMSFSKDILTCFPSVGPVYFILLLFVVRTIYLFIDKYIEREVTKWIVIICISVGGMIISQNGYWLPWSFDVACYSLVFYKLGNTFKEKDWVQLVKYNHISYFLITPIWAYMIYSGGMEIAIREYGKYGLTIIGSIMGVLVILKLSEYINQKKLLASFFLKRAGQASMIVLIIHTLVRNEINNWISFRFDSTGMIFMIISIIIQVALAIIIQAGFNLLKKLS